MAWFQRADAASPAPALIVGGRAVGRFDVVQVGRREVRKGLVEGHALGTHQTNPIDARIQGNAMLGRIGTNTRQIERTSLLGLDQIHLAQLDGVEEATPAIGGQGGGIAVMRDDGDAVFAQGRLKLLQAEVDAGRPPVPTGNEVDGQVGRIVGELSAAEKTDIQLC